MIVKYKTNYSNDKIERVECLRETAEFVYLPRNARSGRAASEERREAKQSHYGCYYDSWEQARDACVAVAQREVESLRMRLECAKGKLGNVKGMKNPESAK